MSELRILVVDDEPEISSNLEHQLITAGHQVWTVHTFEEGKLKSSQQSFDIAILDIFLPDGNGIDLYRLLRKKNPDLYAIIITGNATLESAITFLNEGVNSYLLKPFSEQQLAAVLLQAEKTILLKSENLSLFQQLNTNRQFYENLLNSTSEAVLVLDPDFKTQYANRAAHELLHISDDFLDNYSLQEHIDDGYKVLTHVYQQLVQGKSVAGYRVSVQVNNKDTFNAHLNADFLFGRENQIEGVIINLSNPLIHDEVLHRILRKEKLLTISHLANSLSHEILNPVNILSGRLQLLKDEINNESFNKALPSLQRQIERILKITELLAKFNLSREDSIPEQCNIVSILEVVLKEKQDQFSRKGIQVKYSTERKAADVEGSPIQFSNAFNYLLENLCELTPNEKILQIHGKDTAHFAHSPGFEYQFIIPEIKLTNDQLFEPYQALDMQMNGLLGLSMVIMHIIFNNYGVNVDSLIQNNSQTLIRLQFPLIQPAISRYSPPGKKQLKKRNKN